MPGCRTRTFPRSRTTFPSFARFREMTNFETLATVSLLNAQNTIDRLVISRIPLAGDLPDDDVQ